MLGKLTKAANLNSFAIIKKEDLTVGMDYRVLSFNRYPTKFGRRLCVRLDAMTGVHYLPSAMNTALNDLEEKKLFEKPLENVYMRMEIDSYAVNETLMKYHFTTRKNPSSSPSNGENTVVSRKTYPGKNKIVKNLIVINLVHHQMKWNSITMLMMMIMMKWNCLKKPFSLCPILVKFRKFQTFQLVRVKLKNL